MNDRLRDFDFKEASVQRTVERAVRGRDDFVNFSEVALAVTGNEIGANIMMLGYAWQKGLVPVGRAALRRAIELNAVGVAVLNTRNTPVLDFVRDAPSVDRHTMARTERVTTFLDEGRE